MYLIYRGVSYKISYMYINLFGFSLRTWNYQFRFSWKFIKEIISISEWQFFSLSLKGVELAFILLNIGTFIKVNSKNYYLKPFLKIPLKFDISEFNYKFISKIFTIISQKPNFYMS